MHPLSVRLVAVILGSTLGGLPALASPEGSDRPGASRSPAGSFTLTLVWSETAKGAVVASNEGENAPAVRLRVIPWPEAGDEQGVPADAMAASFGLDAAVPGTATFEAAVGRWILTVDDDAYWAEAIVLESVAGRVSLASLEVFATADARGSLGVRAGSDLPAQLEATFEISRAGSPPVGGQPGAGGRVVCPIRANEWTCRLPVGRLDLRLSLPSFADSFYWGVELPPRGLTLPETVLHDGSSVFGWVLSESSLAVEQALVTLSPDAGPLTDYQGSQLRWATASTDGRGFFHLAGVPPGQYRLNASRAGALAEGRTVTVGTDRAVPLEEPLVLYEPRELEVFVDPPTDPLGGAWQLDLHPTWSNALTPGRVGVEVEENGYAAVTALAPGVYAVALRDHAKDSWWAGTFEVNATAPPLLVSVDAVSVEGRIRLGDEPLAAAVTFHRAGLQRTLSSDSDGSFAGILPSAGRYDVAVEAAEPNVRHSKQGVEVEARDARLDIQIPATRIFGTVADADGRSPATSIVTVSGNGAETFQEVVVGGSFEVVGVPEGSATLGAQGGGLRSDVIRVDVSEEEDREVLLILRERRTLHLRVSGPTGLGIAGAGVTARWEGAAELLPLSVTDGDGRVEIAASPDVRYVTVAIEPPGFAYRQVTLPVPEDGEMVVGVAPERGALVIEPPAAYSPLWGGPQILLVHGAAVVPAGALAQWAHANGGSIGDAAGEWTIPAVEPGPYEACLAPGVEIWRLASGVRLPEWACVAGDLSVGGSLTLSLR